ncbi:unnamed protein product [Rangifer tarandus platyrhynchus]|uniref:Uncharacterized protein n=1 Tax=Rangifer tarandus platyrhynchus TaxID=3082113 RepID=A0AC60A9G3_RANTA
MNKNSSGRAQELTWGTSAVVKQKSGDNCTERGGSDSFTLLTSPLLRTEADTSSLNISLLPPSRPEASPWSAGSTLAVNPDVCSGSGGKTHPGSLQRTPPRCAHSGPAPPAAHLHATGLSSITGHRALCVPVMRPCNHSGVADSRDPLPADGLWTQNQPSPPTLACTVGLPCS